MSILPSHRSATTDQKLFIPELYEEHNIISKTTYSVVNNSNHVDQQILNVLTTKIVIVPQEVNNKCQVQMYSV